MELADKVAYITGGSKGIGIEVAKALLSQGMRVAISGRRQETLNNALDYLNAPEHTMAIVSDVAQYENEENAIAQVLDRFGQIDMVLANAGIGIFESVDAMTIEDWHQMINTNLNGVFHTLKAAVGALKKSKGYYMTLASLAGTNFFPKGAGYNATKFGVVGFTQAAMLDLRKYDIKVTTIMPGSVATFFNGNEPSTKDAWKIQPEDIGKLVVDLLQMPARTLPSKIELRPSRPDLKNS
ncbi:MAG: SDR family oxidoreductase [Bacteroidota bacterium]